jgi:hypothetical protein
LALLPTSLEKGCNGIEYFWKVIAEQMGDQSGNGHLLLVYGALQLDEMNG